jgi:glycolate oxidase iron-sulfur subunit
LQAQPKSEVTDKLLRFGLRNLWSSPARLRLFFAGARLFRDLGLAKLLRKSGVARMFSPRAEFALALLESSRPIFKTRKRKKFTAPLAGGSNPTVALFTGCVGEGLFARVNRATERVLRANGFQVNAPTEQVCCGALHAHAGDLEGARGLARKNIEAFDSAGTIITNAGGCGAMLETYGHLFSNDEKLAAAAADFSKRVRDISEQLQPQTLSQTATKKRVTYDTSCHLLYGQHAGDASQQMLRSVTSARFTPLEGTERCCGAAGLYNLLQPEMSRRVLQEKLDHIRETDADVLATGNPGCQMQIGAGALLAGMSLQVCHPIELVDEAYERSGMYGPRTNTD